MTWAVAGVLVAIIGVPLAAVGLWYTARQQAREQAKTKADELQGKYNDGFQKGLDQAEPTAALLRSQRDDARRERDIYMGERDRALSRIDQLEDQLRARGNQ